jgi:NADPH2:quinone reductase
MTTTRAVAMREAGDASVLELVDRPVRPPGPGEVLVDVAAAGLNRADLMQRQGKYPAPPGTPAEILGLEYAGVVARVGAGVTLWRAGDEVMGIVAGGAMATRLVVHEREAVRVPRGLSLAQAAAVPEAFLTAWDALDQAGLRTGETVLVHSVASGVGTAALQLAHQAGARVVGTSRSAKRLERCLALAPMQSVAVEGTTFAERIASAGWTPDVVLDLVGGAYVEENLKVAAPGGRIMLVGTTAGARASVTLGPWMAKRVTVIGTVLRSRPPEEKLALARAFERRVVPMFEAGLLRPVVDTVLPMTSVREAHERLERGDVFGKLVLRWD